MLDRLDEAAYRPAPEASAAIVTALAGIAALLLVLAPCRVSAGWTPLRDARAVPKDHQVVSVTLCRGQYDVALADGSHRLFSEANLAFRVETGEFGAAPPTPVLLPSRRVADRALVVFPSLEALKAVVKA